MKNLEQIQRDAELTIIKQRVIHFVKVGVKRQITDLEWRELKQLEKRRNELKSL